MRTTFTEWYAEVNRICIAKCGLGIDDLSDGPSRDAFDSGYTPEEYVEERLEEEGFPDEDDEGNIW